jgi:hypothetical protein
VEITGDIVAVIFMDHLCRQYLRYNFQEKQPSRLFLASAYYWDYEEGGNSPVSTKLFAFDENGLVIMEERDGNGKVVRELETVASISENWERYPDFGDYASICNENRSVSKKGEES